MYFWPYDTDYLDDEVSEKREAWRIRRNKKSHVVVMQPAARGVCCWTSMIVQEETTKFALKLSDSWKDERFHLSLSETSLSIFSYKKDNAD